MNLNDQKLNSLRGFIWTDRPQRLAIIIIIIYIPLKRLIDL